MLRSRLTTRLPILVGGALLGLAVARADVIYLEAGGQYKGKILRETAREVVIKTAAGEVAVPRRDIRRLVREDDVKATFDKKWKEIELTGDADAFYELGQWAKGQGQQLAEESKRCWEKAIALDGFHKRAREALGHVQHGGRWYSEDDYKREVQGLVRWDGRWVTAEDRDLLAQGLVQDASGAWVRPDGSAAPTPPRRPTPAASKPDKPAEKASAVPAGQPRPPRGSPGPMQPAGEPDARDKEDKAWYLDTTRVGDFDAAATIESKYYKIKTNVKPEYATRYGEMMDRYYGRFLKVFKEFLPPGEISKSTIWIYSSQQEFMGSTGMPDGVGGFYNTGNKRVTGYHGTFGNNGNTRTVLAHEGTHQFEDVVLQGSFGNCPIWILEGLAVFFESAFWDGEDVVIGLVPTDRLSALKRGLQANSLIPLSQLIRTPQPQFTAYHYAHAWSLIYMVLYYGGNKAVRQRCQQWFTDLMMSSRQGPVTAEMVEERCGGKDKFLELEQKWKEWLGELSYDFDPRKSK